MIRTPKFWQSINIVSILLYPLAMVYRMTSLLLYKLKTPKKFSTKIICIGNAVAGGSGKTPSTIMLAKALKKKGYKVALVCKNYNANIKNPTQITRKHIPPDVVDESILLSKIADTFVAQNLIDVINFVDRKNYDFIITDDGLQNNRFYKDISILVINGNIGVGNNLCIPAGPLREPLESALTRSNYVFLIGEDKQNLKKLITKEKIITVDRKILKSPEKKSNYIAFTGIAYPQNFFDTLKENLYKVIHKIPFPDHHIYSQKDITSLLNIASKEHAKLITTEKDYTKIDKSHHCKIEFLPIEFTAQNMNIFIDTLKEI